MDLVAFKERFEPIFQAYIRTCLKEMRARLQDPFLRKIMEQAGKIALAGGRFGVCMGVRASCGIKRR